MGLFSYVDSGVGDDGDRGGSFYDGFVRDRIGPSEDLVMETVLIVDDSAAQREMIAALLQSHNYAVWMAEDGVEALERAHQTSPDLILLDVLMPRMNGYEACRKLKGDPLTRDIPVVLCSSKTTPIDHHWGMKLGAVAYVDKPSYQEQLVATVQKVLGS